MENSKSKKLIRIDPIPKKKCLIQCDCHGDHFLQFLTFEREPVDNLDKEEYEELYVTMSGCEISRLRDRFKIAWKLIRFGEYQNYGVLVEKTEIQNIINYLKKILSYWKRLRNTQDLKEDAIEMSIEELDKTLDDLTKI